MKFEELVKLTMYRPSTLAKAVLYGIGSKRLLAQIKQIGYEIDPSQRKSIVQIVAGNKTVRKQFEISQIQDEPSSTNDSTEEHAA